MYRGRHVSAIRDRSRSSTNEIIDHLEHHTEYFADNLTNCDKRHEEERLSTLMQCNSLLQKSLPGDARNLGSLREDSLLRARFINPVLIGNNDLGYSE